MHKSNSWKLLIVAIVVCLAIIAWWYDADAGTGPELVTFEAGNVVIRWENIPAEYCGEAQWATVGIEDENGYPEPWLYIPSLWCKTEGETLVREWVYNWAPSRPGVFHPIRATILPDIEVTIPQVQWPGVVLWLPIISR